MVLIGGRIVECVPFGMVERAEIVRGGTEQFVVQTDSAFLGLLITYCFELGHRPSKLTWVTRQSTTLVKETR